MSAPEMSAPEKFTKTLQNLGGNIQSGINEGVRELQGSFKPLTTRTTQLFQGAFGKGDGESELPSDYLKLEKEVDSMRQVYRTVLSVTSVYENESYDYPSNIRENFAGFSKTLSEKVQGLQIKSLSPVKTPPNSTNDDKPADVDAAETHPSAPVRQPRTLNHAISRSLTASKTFVHEDVHFGEALSNVAETEETIGQARLLQDSSIHSGLNLTLQKALKETFHDIALKRKKVEKARNDVDSLRHRIKNSTPEQQEVIRGDLLKAEDEFVNSVSDSTSAMKKLLNTGDNIDLLSQLVQAQFNFHKTAVESLADLQANLDVLKEKSLLETPASEDNGNKGPTVAEAPELKEADEK